MYTDGEKKRGIELLQYFQKTKLGQFRRFYLFNNHHLSVSYYKQPFYKKRYCCR